MLDILNDLSINLRGADFVLLASCAALLGLDKAGLRGTSIITVPVFASYFGGRQSASIVLPFLLTGDILALLVYREKIQLSLLKKMLPLALVGMAVGMILGNVVSDTVFRMIMACIVLFCLFLMALKEFGQKDIVLPDHWAAHGAGGFLGGLSTMIGNAAGPIMAAYLLSLNLPKAVFIGTGALFFFIVNTIKIPVHGAVWGTLTLDSLKFSVLFLPFIAGGFFLGLKIVKRIPDRPFRIFIIAATLVGTVRLFFI
ncbi:MAG: sulfite exporter TauE/SafE family protein [Spirochaetales bacterium]|nr:sulfite exporter TauE/SafE family protein [Spirochaetales bacterium]